MQKLWRLWHLFVFILIFIHHDGAAGRRARCLARRAAPLRGGERSRRDCRAAETIVAGRSVFLRCG